MRIFCFADWINQVKNTTEYSLYLTDHVGFMGVGRLISVSYWDSEKTSQIRLTTYLTIEGKKAIHRF